MRFTFILKNSNTETTISTLYGAAAEKVINTYMALYTNDQLIAMDEACEIQLDIELDSILLVLYC